MDKIDFFIVGAPKCGTTALATYLSENTNINFAKSKEPHFFAKDFENYILTNTYDEYKTLFNKKNNGSIMGEGSVFYLYSKVALKEIKNYNKSAKIIVMLRKPTEMVYSFHAQLVASGDENIVDFEKAWRLCNDRKQMKKISKITREPKLLYYDEIAKYYNQLVRLKLYFPNEQIKIILFEDFKRDTKQVYNEVLRFLNVEVDDRQDFPKINTNDEPISKTLNFFLKNFPQPLKNLYKIVKKILKIKAPYGLIIKKIIKLNRREKVRKKLSEKIKNEIIKNYINDIKKLSKMLNRDLSSWYEQI